MKQSESVFLDIRGVRYHLRTWGNPSAPKLFLTHGWWDMSASWQFVVDSFKHDWHVIAPDWRGHGLTQADPGNMHQFNNNLADLDRILHHFSPDQPVRIGAHSMSFNVASVYAGVRPERVEKLVNVECYGFRKVVPEDALGRFQMWLKTFEDAPAERTYDSLEKFADRLIRQAVHLTPERALFLASHLLRKRDDGLYTLSASPALRDPARLLIYLGGIRIAEAMAIWRQVTAPVLWISAVDSATREQIGATEEEIEERKACFRNLTFRGIRKAGHMVHQEQPEELAAVMEEFFLG